MDRTATIVFTRKNIEEFCVLTGDTNLIHDARYMLKCDKPKEPIIPGMMLFAHMLSKIGHRDSLRQASLYFSGVNCSNQQITCSIRDSLEARFKINLNGGGESETARFFLSPKTSIILNDFPNGKSSVLLREPKDYETFRKITGMENVLQGDFFYTLCCSSEALLDRVKMPGTKEEKEISSAMSQGNKSRLPVYNSIQAIFESDAYSKVDRKNPLCFSSLMSKKNDREYMFELECEQEETLYRARLELTLVPERLLRKGAIDAVEALVE